MFRDMNRMGSPQDAFRWEPAHTTYSVPVGVLYRTGAPESLYVWLKIQEIVALMQHTLWKPDLQEINQHLLLSVEIRGRG